MYNDSKFKDILSIITYFILPIGAIIWPFFLGKPILLEILFILLHILGLMALNLVIEKLFDNDDMAEFFAVGLLISIFVFAIYWPFVVCPPLLAPIIGLASVAVLSIGIRLFFEDLDFLEVVFVVTLALLASYWPWVVFGFKGGIVVFIIEAGVILFGVGAWTEIEAMRNVGIAICALFAVGWPWVFFAYNIAIIIILAELFALALIYEVFKGFADKGIILGMLVFLILLAFGWPWLAFIGMEKYLWYAIPACVMSGTVAGIIAKLVASSLT